jgi:hypothetical protein
MSAAAANRKVRSAKLTPEK